MTASGRSGTSSLAKRTFGFLLVGAFSVALTLLLITLLVTYLGMNVYVGYFIAYGLTIVSSYFMNSLLVFHHELGIYRMVQYCLIYCTSLLFGLVLIFVFSKSFHRVSPALVAYATVPFTTAYNFIFVNKLLRLKERKRPNL